MKIQYALSVLLFMSTIAVASPASDKDAIRKARLDQNAAIVRHDIEAIASFWTDDVTICRALGAQNSGKAAYRKLFEDDDPRSKDTVLYQRHPSGIEVAAGYRLAFETGVFEGRRGGVGGPVVLRGRYSAQWVQRGERWLIRSELYVALSGSDQMHAVP
jgi:ketosteroid isomerase-like protein